MLHAAFNQRWFLSRASGGCHMVKGPRALATAVVHMGLLGCADLFHAGRGPGLLLVALPTLATRAFQSAVDVIHVYVEIVLCGVTVLALATLIL